jgi:hypothetical protein
VSVTISMATHSRGNSGISCSMTHHMVIWRHSIWVSCKAPSCLRGDRYIGTVWLYSSHVQDHHYLATAFGPRPECSCSSELHFDHALICVLPRITIYWSLMINACMILTGKKRIHIHHISMHAYAYLSYCCHTLVFHVYVMVYIYVFSNFFFCEFRFHLLDEFDDSKKSCRKRLADHNRRRRKSKPSETDAADKRRTQASKAASTKGSTCNASSHFLFLIIFIHLT